MITPVQNLRVGIRSLRRTPGFALAAVLTLALGIGLSTAVFTVADTLLLRRLPVHDQDRVVVLWGELPKRGLDHSPLTLTDARTLARGARTLQQVAYVAYEGAWPQPIREGDRITRLRQALVSGNFFDVLGARPALGRALRPDDDVIGASPVLVLSYGTWQQRFGSDPHVLGRQLVMYGSGRAYTIVGVMPQGLAYPRGADFWAPLLLARDSANGDVDVVARLAPHATPASARAELTAFFGRTLGSSWRHDSRGVVHTLPQIVLGDTRPAVLVFSAAVGLLLLITCINVANLLLVRGLARVREIAVRSALGAGRVELVMQLLGESVLLAVAGGALGLLIAAGAIRSFVAFAPAGVPRLDEIHLNATAVAGAVAITSLAMLVFALAPALMTSRVELQQVLRSDARQSASRRRRLLTETLVAGQIALALVVLSAAGLIARSLLQLERATLAFEPSHLLIGELALRYDQYDDTAKQLALLDALLPALRAIPGVRAASPVVAIPFAGSGGWDGRPVAEGQSAEVAAASPMLNMEVVAPDYFATLGLSVLRGRAFTEQDREGAPRVVMVSQTAARHYWPDEDPIGKRLKMGQGASPWMTVVGVVPDTRYRELRQARPSIYFPLHQPFFPYEPLDLAIRTSGPPAALVPAIRRVISAIEPGVALASAAPFQEYLDGPLAQPRLNALLLAIFAAAAVLLAAVGLFGVMATMVRQRTREIGVRMALGATSADLRSMVLQRGLAIAAIGVLAGLCAAFAANRLVASLLYQVSPTDALTLALVTTVLLGVAILASIIPARSSTRVDPVIALRSEG